MVMIQGIKKLLLRLFFAAFLAVFITVLVDLAAAWIGMYATRVLYFGCFAVLMLTFLCIPWFTGKRLAILAAGLPAVLVVVAAAGFLFWKSFSVNAVYRDVDSGKERLYANQRVMLIVPHEDDEINVLGGVMEEYVEYGSDVYPVFVTNGDYRGLAETRFSEAIEVAEFIGIPKENVIFLGYGDQWKEGGPHIYNAEPGVVVESFVGKTETYGTRAKSAYREGRAYTIDNLMEDLSDVILEYRPDVIFCSDYDSHIDHKATTLVFEKVMGEILKEEPDYRPIVYKGFAYSAAWYSVPDYHAVNMRQTCNVFAEPLYQQPAVYRWGDRIRLPVSADTLSRSIRSSSVYHTLAIHASQDATSQASRVINGDRVVWERETNSLCYNAEIETSSSDADLLNDFMLIDNIDLADESRMPYDGTWIPEAGDTEKTVTVTFPELVDISRIVLYDHPSEEHNVLKAVIRFDDGSEINVGALDPDGAATQILVEKYAINCFTVTLLETQGELAGLTEIEAFQENRKANVAYIKIMDENEDFAYDYWVDRQGRAEFSVYSYGDAGSSGYSVSWDNERCNVVLEDDVVIIECPKGEATIVTISCDETNVSDSVYVSNPGFFRRLQCDLCQKVEEFLLDPSEEGWYWRSMTYEVIDILRYKLEHLLA